MKNVHNTGKIVKVSTQFDLSFMFFLLYFLLFL